MKGLVGAAALIVGVVAPATAGTSDGRLFARLKAAETVRLTVEETYVYQPRNGAGEVVLSGYRLPFARTAEDLLGAAGLHVVGPGARVYDATLAIRARGRAIGRRYHAGVTGLLYAGAGLEGEIVLGVPGFTPWRMPFRGREMPPIEVSLNLGYEQPANAPFAEIFARPASFLPRMVEVIGEVYGAAPLIAVIGEESGEGLRRSAAHVLGALGDTAAVDPLIAALADADAGLRREAAWALGKLGDGRAVAALEVALADGDADVRWFAAWALARITGRTIDESLATAAGGDGEATPRVE